jgi:hypothetical protein
MVPIAGERAAFVEGIPGQDRVVFDRLSAMLPGAEFVPSVDVWDRGLPARAGQAWVSTRFHCHLLAAAAGASGVALSGRRDYYPVNTGRWSTPVPAGTWPIRPTSPTRRRRAEASTRRP